MSNIPRYPIGSIVKKSHDNVFLSNHLEYGKIIFKKFHEGKIDEFEKEKIIQNLKHPYIINYFKFENNIIIMEYLPKGNLYQYLRKNPHISFLTRIRIAIELSSAIKKLQDEKISHNDLKTENVFLTHNLHIKLGDFGYATRININNESCVNTSGSPPGSTIYMAPERFFGKLYYNSDIFSLGIVFIELFGLTKPFQNWPNENILKFHKEKSTINISENIPSSIKDIIKQCLEHFPEKRISIFKIIKDLDEILFKEEQDTQNNGIINNLRKNNIEPLATASSIFSNFVPERAIPKKYDPKDGNVYLSEDKPNQWLKVEFKKLVKIYSYTLKLPKKWVAPKHFILETSKDGETWKKVDEQKHIDIREKNLKIFLDEPKECYF